jgi:exodeoxyribonuclease V alpha subunit
MAAHVSVRLYWHDHGWDGTICRDPKGNVWCEGHDHVREYKDADAELAEAGQRLGLAAAKPPCEASAQAFARQPNRIVIHPPDWMRNLRVQPVEWDFAPTSGTLWPYEDFWHEGGAHKSNEERRILAEAFFTNVVPGESLAFFYVDERNPLFIDDGERSPARVLVGVSRIAELGRIEEWAEETYGERNMVWAVPFRHAYPRNGIRLPVHAILNALPDAEQRRPYLVPLDGGLRTDFRYGSMVVSLDRALVALERAVAALSAIQRDRVLEDDFTTEMEWLNARVLELWKERGPYPGIGAVLQALGAQRAAELQRSVVGDLALKGVDAAEAVFSALDGDVRPELAPYRDDLELAASEWDFLDEEDRELARVLCRMELEAAQAPRLLEPDQRVRHGLPAEARAILANPYVIAERYLPPRGEEPIGFVTVDHALYPHESMPAPTGLTVGGRDPRRVRALLTEVLRDDAEDGHTFTPAPEALQRVAQRSPPDRPCDMPERRLDHPKVAPILDETLERFEVDGLRQLALQDLRNDELKVEEVFRALAGRRPEPVEQIEWQAIADELSARGGSDAVTLSEEQHAALQRSFASPVSVITGAAGTGKSTLLAPLIAAVRHAEGQVGVRALAPTGKAADRLKDLHVDAMTIHRALASAGWYDWKLGVMRSDGETRIEANTIIIDEASMIDVELLATLFRAIEWHSVGRLVLVGDYHQLPPIGPGRPFFDLIAMQRPTDEDDRASDFKGRLSELTHNYRVQVDGSRAIALANGFAGTAEPDDPLIWGAIARGEDQGDLRVRYWQDADELQALVLADLDRLLAETAADNGWPEQRWTRFNASIGHTDGFDASFWQILVPVRGARHGSQKLNAIVQDEYHGGLKRTTRTRWGVKFGDEQITAMDKVMQIANDRLEGYRVATREKEKIGVFNGQLGTVRGEWPSAAKQYRKANERGGVKLINIEFDGQPGVRFSYADSGWNGVDRHLQLAYAITVHKSQGSQFGHVFLVLPRVAGDFLSRELIYTGLTRAQSQLTLYIEKDVSTLLPLRKHAAAQTPRRRTRMFGIHAPGVTGYHAERLIHVTARNELVRSKSEVIIANRLADHRLAYEYEKELIPPGGDERDMRLPDFTIMHEGTAYYWEHCGMMSDPVYAQKWRDVRLPWYKRHGLDSRLIVTEDGPDGSIDTPAIDAKIAELFG